jgi:hypothetical protein
LGLLKVKVMLTAMQMLTGRRAGWMLERKLG